MTLSFTISRQAEARLRAKAASAGMDVETYVARYLEFMAASPKSLKEISGPIAKNFARSGLSEDDLAAFLEAEKHEMRAKRRSKRAG